MRHFVTGWAFALAVTVFTSATWAGNQEVAERIAEGLRQSGKMQDYRIGVKYQEGTVWLVGRVASEKQLTTALNLVMQTPGVERVINNLSVSGQETASAKPAPESVAAASTPSPAIRYPGGSTAVERLQRILGNRGENEQPAANETERGAVDELNRAERVPVSFESAPASPTSVTQPTQTQQPGMAEQMVPAQHPVMAAQAQPRMARQPVPVAYTQPHGAAVAPHGMTPGGPRPMYTAAAGGGVAPARYDQPRMPNYAWPSYAAYPNYAAVTYPKQYSPTAWPYIGPFYPYPQVPLGWRKVTLEWDNGWWMLDFKDR